MEKAQSSSSGNLQSTVGVMSFPEIECRNPRLFAFGREEARKGGRIWLFVSFSKESLIQKEVTASAKPL